MAANLTDAQRLVAAVTEAGGRVPDALERLLAAAELLMAPSAVDDPVAPILARALDGKLDAKVLDTMVATAAAQQNVADYRSELRGRAERVVAQRFHKALGQGGCADLILGSLRGRFDAAAEKIAVARSLINPESSAEHVIASGQPELVEAWRTLDDHLAVLGAIGSIAAQFGARPSARFPLITEHPGDNYKTDDVALFCGSGGLETDSAPFLRQQGRHRQSPWFLIPLRLNTVAQAEERYRLWAASQWDAQHPNPTIQYTNPDDGSVAEMTLVNPFRREEVDA
jgi:hypothetical protein